MQFEQNVVNCLRPWANQITNQEYTQELKLPDAMPDIGTVLGAWGQTVLRGKEWRSDGMGITGGMMAWILYAPEDGSHPRVAEGWIPFQMRWDFPRAERDGSILASCLLRSVDARCLSARKLLIRCTVSVGVQALEPSQYIQYRPHALPEDVCLLKNHYPVCIPVEAGEKMFQLDEEPDLPSECAAAVKLLNCRVLPQITDQKIMGDKAVFRGAAVVRCLLRLEDGSVKGCSFDIPFSQYAQLDREYSENAQVQILPALTSLEPELAEPGKLRIKLGFTGQYVIFDRHMLELVEDAYSPVRTVNMQMDMQDIPNVLDFHREVITVRRSVPNLEGVDVCFGIQCPEIRTGSGSVCFSLEGAFTVLGKNPQGDLQGVNLRWDDSCTLETHENTKVTAECYLAGVPSMEQLSDQLEMRCDVVLEAVTMAAEPMTQIMSLELGEKRQRDPARPSLVLRRAGSQGLWQIAKAEGSTVEAICAANGLSGEPEAGRMLLIPVC